MSKRRDAQAIALVNWVSRAIGALRKPRGHQITGSGMAVESTQSVPVLWSFMSSSASPSVRRDTPLTDFVLLWRRVAASLQGSVVNWIPSELSNCWRAFCAAQGT